MENEARRETEKEKITQAIQETIESMSGKLADVTLIHDEKYPTLITIQYEGAETTTKKQQETTDQIEEHFKTLGFKMTQPNSGFEGTEGTEEYVQVESYNIEVA